MMVKACASCVNTNVVYAMYIQLSVPIEFIGVKWIEKGNGLICEMGEVWETSRKFAFYAIWLHFICACKLRLENGTHFHIFNDTLYIICSLNLNYRLVRTWQNILVEFLMFLSNWNDDYIKSWTQSKFETSKHDTKRDWVEKTATKENFLHLFRSKYPPNYCNPLICTVIMFK